MTDILVLAHKHVVLWNHLNSAKIYHTWLNFITSTAVSKATSRPSLFQAATIKGPVLSAQGAKMWCFKTQKPHLIGGVAMVTTRHSDGEGVNEWEKQFVCFSIVSAPSDRILKGWDSFTHSCSANITTWITLLYTCDSSGELCTQQLQVREVINNKIYVHILLRDKRGRKHDVFNIADVCVCVTWGSPLHCEAPARYGGGPCDPRGDWGRSPS